MRAPTRRALRRKSRAIITKEWAKDEGSQLVEEHFEWFETAQGQSDHFDYLSDWAEKDVVDDDDALHLAIEVLDTETLQLGRSHIAPRGNSDLKAILEIAKKNPGSLLTSPPTENSAINDLVDYIGRLGADVIEIQDNGNIDFIIDDVPCFAYVQAAGRIRGTVWLDVEAPETESENWVANQPQPRSGLLETLSDGNGHNFVRILFERNLDAEWVDDDPLSEDARIYADCWRDRRVVEAQSGVDDDSAGDPRDVAPANAWLLVGAEDSWPATEDLAEAAARGSRGIFENYWTTSKRTDVGDLMVIYFKTPRKAACFVTRAASRAFFDTSIDGGREREFSQEQWWCYLTPLIEIEPIPLATLQELADGFLPLRGKAGVYLRPDFVASLPVAAKHDQDAAALAKVLQPVVGVADLPRPASITPATWRTIASGALPMEKQLEKQVELYIVEPLLRLTLSEQVGMTWQRSFRIGRKVADYVVTRDGAPVCVLEVKVAVRKARDGGWATSKDFQQVRGYADELDCNSVLIDANRIYLIHPRANEPYRVLERRDCTLEDIKQIGDHFQGAPI